MIFFDFKIGKAKIAKPTVLELLALVAICVFLALVFTAPGRPLCKGADNCAGAGQRARGSSSDGES